MNGEFKGAQLPTLEQIEAERSRLKRRKEYHKTLRSTIYALIIVAAIAALIATMLLPVLQVSGTSMEPTLENEDIVVLMKSSHFKTGQLVGFYWQNKLLLKRVIAGPGDFVEIDEDGTVYVNGELLDEPYITEKSLGECDLTFPYQVPENHYFVMGDHRETSIDSRSSVIGTVDKEQIIGRVILRVMPLNRFGFVK